MNQLMVIPKCPTHKTPMTYRPGATPEQRWCGAWYDCKEYKCQCSVLIMSAELREVYRKAGKIV